MGSLKSGKANMSHNEYTKSNQIVVPEKGKEEKRRKPNLVGLNDKD